MQEQEPAFPSSTFSWFGAGRSLPSPEGRRILAIRSGALGDTLLALPAVAALRSLVGRSGAVELVGTEPAIRLALGSRLATAVHSIDRALFVGLHQPGAGGSELREFLGRFDFVIAWSRLPHLREKLDDLEIPSIEADPLPPTGSHASDHLYGTLEPFGVSGHAPSLSLEPDLASRKAALEFLARQDLDPRRFVAIHPSSGSRRKSWPKERFRALALRIAADVPVLWIEGEADASIVRDLSSLVPAPVARGLPLEVLGAVLSLAFGYVGNDSGVTHLAAAYGAPTVALFGPTDPGVWSPRAKHVVVADFRVQPDEVWEKARPAFRRP